MGDSDTEESFKISPTSSSTATTFTLEGGGSTTPKAPSPMTIKFPSGGKSTKIATPAEAPTYSSASPSTAVKAAAQHKGGSQPHDDSSSLHFSTTSSTASSTCTSISANEETPVKPEPHHEGRSGLLKTGGSSEQPVVEASDTSNVVVPDFSGTDSASTTARTFTVDESGVESGSTSQTVSTQNSARDPMSTSGQVPSHIPKLSIPQPPSQSQRGIVTKKAPIAATPQKSQPQKSTADIEATKKQATLNSVFARLNDETETAEESSDVSSSDVEFEAGPSSQQQPRGTTKPTAHDSPKLLMVPDDSEDSDDADSSDDGGLLETPKITMKDIPLVDAFLNGGGKQCRLLCQLYDEQTERVYLEEQSEFRKKILMPYIADGMRIDAILFSHKRSEIPSAALATPKQSLVSFWKLQNEIIQPLRKQYKLQQYIEEEEAKAKKRRAGEREKKNNIVDLSPGNATANMGHVIYPMQNKNEDEDEENDDDGDFIDDMEDDIYPPLFAEIRQKEELTRVTTQFLSKAMDPHLLKEFEEVSICSGDEFWYQDVDDVKNELRKFLMDKEGDSRAVGGEKKGGEKHHEEIAGGGGAKRKIKVPSSFKGNAPFFQMDLPLRCLQYAQLLLQEESTRSELLLNTFLQSYYEFLTVTIIRLGLEPAIRKEIVTDENFQRLELSKRYLSIEKQEVTEREELQASRAKQMLSLVHYEEEGGRKKICKDEDRERSIIHGVISKEFVQRYFNVICKEELTRSEMLHRFFNDQNFLKFWTLPEQPGCQLKSHFVLQLETTERREIEKREASDFINYFAVPDLFLQHHEKLMNVFNLQELEWSFLLLLEEQNGDFLTNILLTEEEEFIAAVENSSTRFEFELFQILGRENSEWKKIRLEEDSKFNIMTIEFIQEREFTHLISIPWRQGLYFLQLLDKLVPSCFTIVMEPESEQREIFIEGVYFPQFQILREEISQREASLIALENESRKKILKSFEDGVGGAFNFQLMREQKVVLEEEKNERILHQNRENTIFAGMLHESFHAPVVEMDEMVKRTEILCDEHEFFCYNVCRVELLEEWVILIHQIWEEEDDQRLDLEIYFCQHQEKVIRVLGIEKMERLEFEMFFNLQKNCFMQIYESWYWRVLFHSRDFASVPKIGEDQNEIDAEERRKKLEAIISENVKKKLAEQEEEEEEEEDEYGEVVEKKKNKKKKKATEIDEGRILQALLKDNGDGIDEEELLAGLHDDHEEGSGMPIMLDIQDAMKVLDQEMGEKDDTSGRPTLLSQEIIQCYYPLTLSNLRAGGENCVVDSPMISATTTTKISSPSAIDKKLKKQQAKERLLAEATKSFVKQKTEEGSSSSTGNEELAMKKQKDQDEEERRRQKEIEVALIEDPFLLTRLIMYHLLESRWQYVLSFEKAERIIVLDNYHGQLVLITGESKKRQEILHQEDQQVQEMYFQQFLFPRLKMYESAGRSLLVQMSWLQHVDGVIFRDEVMAVPQQRKSTKNTPFVTTRPAKKTTAAISKQQKGHSSREKLMTLPQSIWQTTQEKLLPDCHDEEVTLPVFNGEAHERNAIIYQEYFLRFFDFQFFHPSLNNLWKMEMQHWEMFTISKNLDFSAMEETIQRNQLVEEEFILSLLELKILEVLEREPLSRQQIREESENSNVFYQQHVCLLSGEATLTDISFNEEPKAREEIWFHQKEDRERALLVQQGREEMQVIYPIWEALRNQLWKERTTALYEEVEKVFYYDVFWPEVESSQDFFYEAGVEDGQSAWRVDIYGQFQLERQLLDLSSEALVVVIPPIFQEEHKIWKCEIQWPEYFSQTQHYADYLLQLHDQLVQDFYFQSASILLVQDYESVLTIYESFFVSARQLFESCCMKLQIDRGASDERRKKAVENDIGEEEQIEKEGKEFLTLQQRAHSTLASTTLGSYVHHMSTRQQQSSLSPSRSRFLDDEHISSIDAIDTNSSVFIKFLHHVEYLLRPYPKCSSIVSGVSSVQQKQKISQETRKQDDDDDDDIVISWSDGNIERQESADRLFLYARCRKELHDLLVRLPEVISTKFFKIFVQVGFPKVTHNLSPRESSRILGTAQISERLRPHTPPPKVVEKESREVKHAKSSKAGMLKEDEAQISQCTSSTEIRKIIFCENIMESQLQLYSNVQEYFSFFLPCVGLQLAELHQRENMLIMPFFISHEEICRSEIETREALCFDSKILMIANIKMLMLRTEEREEKLRLEIIHQEKTEFEFQLASIQLQNLDELYQRQEVIINSETKIRQNEITGIYFYELTERQGIINQEMFVSQEWLSYIGAMTKIVCDEISQRRQIIRRSRKLYRQSLSQAFMLHMETVEDQKRREIYCVWVVEIESIYRRCLFGTYTELLTPFAAESSDSNDKKQEIENIVDKRKEEKEDQEEGSSSSSPYIFHVAEFSMLVWLEHLKPLYQFHDTLLLVHLEQGARLAIDQWQEKEAFVDDGNLIPCFEQNFTTTQKVEQLKEGEETTLEGRVEGEGGSDREERDQRNGNVSGPANVEQQEHGAVSREAQHEEQSSIRKNALEDIDEVSEHAAEKEKETPEEGEVKEEVEKAIRYVSLGLYQEVLLQQEASHRLHFLVALEEDARNGNQYFHLHKDRLEFFSLEEEGREMISGPERQERFEVQHEILLELYALHLLNTVLEPTEKEHFVIDVERPEEAEFQSLILAHERHVCEMQLMGMFKQRQEQIFYQYGMVCVEAKEMVVRASWMEAWKQCIQEQGCCWAIEWVEADQPTTSAEAPALDASVVFGATRGTTVGSSPTLAANSRMIRGRALGPYPVILPLSSTEKLYAYYLFYIVPRQLRAWKDSVSIIHHTLGNFQQLFLTAPETGNWKKKSKKGASWMKSVGIPPSSVSSVSSGNNEEKSLRKSTAAKPGVTKLNVITSTSLSFFSALEELMTETTLAASPSKSSTATTIFSPESKRFSTLNAMNSSSSLDLLQTQFPFRQMRHAERYHLMLFSPSAQIYGQFRSTLSNKKAKFHMGQDYPFLAAQSRFRQYQMERRAKRKRRALLHRFQSQVQYEINKEKQKLAKVRKAHFLAAVANAFVVRQKLNALRIQHHRASLVLCNFFRQLTSLKKRTKRLAERNQGEDRDSKSVTVIYNSFFALPKIQACLRYQRSRQERQVQFRRLVVVPAFKTLTTWFHVICRQVARRKLFLHQENEERFIQRNKIENSKFSALQIQSIWRRYLARKKYIESLQPLRESGILLREKREHRIECVRKIQTCWRSWKSWKVLDNLRRLYSMLKRKKDVRMKKDFCARRIQLWWMRYSIGAKRKRRSLSEERKNKSSPMRNRLDVSHISRIGGEGEGDAWEEVTKDVHYQERIDREEDDDDVDVDLEVMTDTSTTNLTTNTDNEYLMPLDKFQDSKGIRGALREEEKRRQLQEKQILPPPLGLHGTTPLHRYKLWLAGDARMRLQRKGFISAAGGEGVKYSSGSTQAYSSQPQRLQKTSNNRPRPTSAGLTRRNSSTTSAAEAKVSNLERSNKIQRPKSASLLRPSSAGVKRPAATYATPGARKVSYDELVGLKAQTKPAVRTVAFAEQQDNESNNHGTKPSSARTKLSKATSDAQLLNEAVHEAVDSWVELLEKRRKQADNSPVNNNTSKEKPFRRTSSTPKKISHLLQQEQENVTVASHTALKHRRAIEEVNSVGSPKER